MIALSATHNFAPPLVFEDHYRLYFLRELTR